VLVCEGNAFAYDALTGKRRAELPLRRDKPDSRRSVQTDGRIVAHVVPFKTEPADSLRLAVAIHELNSPDPDVPIREFVTNSSDDDLALSPDGRYWSMSWSRRGSVYDTRTGTIVREDMRGIIAFFPDGKSVLSFPGIRGAERVSLEPLIWKVAPPKEPTAKRLVFLWDRLAESGAPALDAVFELARFPVVAVPFLKEKLLTDPADAKAVAGHIGKLGSKLFAERDTATKALRELGPEVLPALREALKTASSPEVRSRIEKLLPELTDTAAPVTLARLRAVEVLERCGTPESRAVLEAVAKRTGTPWADDAARALVRLKR
jgi:PBS lyase HEAT-like repeat